MRKFPLILRVAGLALFVMIAMWPPAQATMPASNLSTEQSETRPGVIADSLSQIAAGYYVAEPSVQTILDEAAPGLSAARDERVSEWFCTPPGMVVVRVVARYSNASRENGVGWYSIHSPSDPLVVLPPSVQVGDSAVFFLSAGDSLGWTLIRTSGSSWRSQMALNRDRQSHVKVYQTANPEEYLLFWEDLGGLTDNDFNDLVLLVRLPVSAPKLSVTPMRTPGLRWRPGTPIDLSITASHYDCDNDSLTLKLVDGPGTFGGARGIGLVKGQHQFTPPATGLYSFVFAAKSSAGASAYDTLTLGVNAPLTPEISINMNNTMTICRPETVCVPFHVLSPCPLSGFRTSSPAFVKLPDSSLCIYVDRTSSFSVSLVALDQCGGKDSVRVGFNITRNQPAAVIAPSVIDTLLCKASWICIPIGVTGTAPVSVSAVSPAVYNANTKTVCYKVNTPGTHHVKMIAANSCGPETTVTEIHAVFNSPPTISGIPNDTVKVCQTSGPYCFGPITCSDPDGNGNGCLLGQCPGSFDGQYWCYTPSGPGTVVALFYSSDACGAVTLDTLIIRFGAGSVKPNITFTDVAAKLCAPDSVCVPFSISNPSQRPLHLSLSGVGALHANDSTVCRMISAAGIYTVKLIATDDCGSADTAQGQITATMNQAPVVACTPPAATTICAGAPACVRYTASDTDGGLLRIDIDAGGTKIVRQAFSPTTDSACINVTQPGAQTVRVIVTDSCGAADTCTSIFTMTVNTPPTASVRDTAINLCSPQSICIPYSCSDPDNNLVSCAASGTKSGTANGTTFSFTPDTAGVYRVTVLATDACGQTSQKIANVDVRYNAAPTITLTDSIIFNATDKETVCVSYTATDPEGKPLTIANIGGILRTATHQFCVVASAGNVVCGRIIATDPCGKADTSQLCVQTIANPTPKPNIPDTIRTRFCGTGDVCVRFSLGPSNCPPLTLSALNGGVVHTQDSTLCLMVYGPGTYLTGLVARDNCGAETTIVIIQVKANNRPVIVCPQPEVFRICHDTTICLIVAYADPDSNFANASVSYGTVAPAFKGLFKVCMPVDTSGWYTSRLIVRDSCGAADTCDLAMRVLRNTPPKVLMPNDTALFLCFPRELCFPVSCFDPDYNIVQCGPVSLGDAHWDGTSLCLTPIANGTYQWVFTVLDACGALAVDTFRVTIQLNRPPTITAPPSTHFVLCQPETVCVPFTVSDPDGGTLIVLSDKGVVRNGQVCLYRQTIGTENVQLIVKDSCCFADTTTIAVTFDLNAPPTVTAPGDFTRNVCGLGQVCFGVNIHDDRPQWTASVAPIGVFNPTDTTVCFYADTSGTYRLIVTATDSCKAISSDTVNVRVNFNHAPVVVAPSSTPLTACSPGTVCVGGISVTDPDGNLKRTYLTAGTGTLDVPAGTLCFAASTSGTYCFDITAEDSCGTTSTRRMCVVVSLNHAPTVTISGLPTTALYLHPTQVCFSVGATDPDPGQLFDLQMVEGAGVFTRQIGRSSINAQHCFTADTTGCYRFIFATADSCGLAGRDTATICIRIEPPDSLFQICIDTVQSLSGRNVTVKTRGIRLMEMGGYNFLICYDPTMLHFVEAAPDTALSQWEYFTFRIGSGTNCLPCGTGVIRLIGIADMNNGSPHPPTEAFLPKGPMHNLTFFVTADRTFINMCGAVRFCSYECGDNTISSRSGDTLYTAFTGVADSCFRGPKNIPVRAIDFCDGSVCIIPPPDDRGDMNLNGIANEVADAVLYSNYFIYGLKVFDPIYKENQILASDVNCDGLVLTISDLVRMIRIVTGEDQAQGCPGGPAKVVAAEYRATVTAERESGRLTVYVTGETDLGGVFVRLTTKRGKVSPITWAADLGGLTSYQSVGDGEVRALLVARRSGTKLASGTHLLFTMPWDGVGECQVQDAQASTVMGDFVETELLNKGTGIPASFDLEQNYPNPFNASTQIRFSLGSPAKWDLTIFNVLGQPVRQFQGTSEPGLVTVEWNATTDDGAAVASGIYFARLKAGDFTATKKMALLK